MQKWTVIFPIIMFIFSVPLRFWQNWWYSDGKPRREKYRKARETLENGRPEEAMALFRELGRYKDSRDRYREACFLYGKELFGLGRFEESCGAFESAGEYGEARAYLEIAKRGGR